MITVPEKFIPENYRQCTLTVMDNIQDPNITFDENGVCNYYHEYKTLEEKEVFQGEAGQKKLEEWIDKIKRNGKGKNYDCILGVSGGVDSTYLAYLAKDWGLRVLCVHFDNGWNSELAVKNIENIVNKCNFDLYTHVFDWEQFRDLQIAHFKANVVDIEGITDVAIGGTLRLLALKNKLKYVLSGGNIVTESILPKYWIYKDYYNIMDIYRKYGSGKRITTFPFWDSERYRLEAKLRGVSFFSPLNFVSYIKNDVKKFIAEKLDWNDYGGKHYESVFTRFYQGYILPNKFGIDKRKAHLSNLIASGQINREEALSELSEPIMKPEQVKTDYDFVIKKLGFTREEFENYIRAPRREHTDFDNQEDFFERSLIKKTVRKVFAQ